MKRRKKAVKRRRQARAAAVPANLRARLPNYDEILLENMLNFGHAHSVTLYATLFNSVLSNISHGVRDQYYKSGIRIGRSLYRICESKKRYSWYEESVADLVGFFERAGYRRITYNVFPDMIEIRLHHGRGMQLGANVHVFEAGVMSGFLTAGKRGLVHMNEVACADNGGEFCRFVSSSDYRGGEIGPQVADRFFEYLSEHQNERLGQDTGRGEIPEEYYLLSSIAFMGREYTNEMRQIMLHMGGRLGGLVNITSARAERLVGLLGLGELSISKLKPLRGSIAYKGLRAREEFVGISVAFIDGLLSGKIGKDVSIEAVATAKANRYNVALTERKASSR